MSDVFGAFLGGIASGIDFTNDDPSGGFEKVGDTFTGDTQKESPFSGLFGGYIDFIDMINGGGPGQRGDTFQGGPFSDWLNDRGVKPNKYLSFKDMRDGGGPGRSGDSFVGGPLSDSLNSLGITPAGTPNRSIFGNDRTSTMSSRDSFGMVPTGGAPTTATPPPSNPGTAPTAGPAPVQATPRPDDERWRYGPPADDGRGVRLSTSGAVLPNGAQPGEDEIALARRAAEQEGVDPDLFVRLVAAESTFNPSAVSPRGAMGYAQLMEGTAADLGVNRADPWENLVGGARYLKQQIDAFGSVELGLAAYNAGPGRVRASGNQIPKISETQDYVAKILNGYTPASQDVRLSTRGAATAQPIEAAFTADGLNIEYAGDPEFHYGRHASANAEPFQAVVFHHTAEGTDLDSMVSYGKRVDPGRGGHAYGYHFYVGPDGRIVQGAPLDKRTNHIKPTEDVPFSNTSAIGISLVGAENGATPEQTEAARALAGALADKFGIEAFHGHGEIQSNRMETEGRALAELLRSRGVSAEDAEIAAETLVMSTKGAPAPEGRGVTDALPAQGTGAPASTLLAQIPDQATPDRAPAILAAVQAGNVSPRSTTMAPVTIQGENMPEGVVAIEFDVGTMPIALGNGQDDVIVPASLDLAREMVAALDGQLPTRAIADAIVAQGELVPFKPRTPDATMTSMGSSVAFTQDLYARASNSGKPVASGKEMLTDGAFYGAWKQDGTPYQPYGDFTTRTDGTPRHNSDHGDYSQGARLVGGTARVRYADGRVEERPTAEIYADPAFAPALGLKAPVGGQQRASLGVPQAEVPFQAAAEMGLFADLTATTANNSQFGDFLAGRGVMDAA